jgi:hypothetical protein
MKETTMHEAGKGKGGRLSEVKVQSRALETQGRYSQRVARRGATIRAAERYTDGFWSATGIRKCQIKDHARARLGRTLNDRAYVKE